MAADDIRIISVICPTYGRTARLGEMVKSFVQTQHGWSVLYLAPRWDGELISDTIGDSKWLVTHLPYVDRTMTQAFSSYAIAFARSCAMIGLGANDLIYVTPGWDDIILREQEKRGPGIYYCRDNLRDKDLCNHPFITTDILWALGWGALEGTKHLYLDNTWFEIGKALNRLYYLPDVVIEHRHPTKFKDLDDDHYRRVNAKAVYEHDGAIFDKWKKERLADDVAKIKTALRLP